MWRRLIEMLAVVVMIVGWFELGKGKDCKQLLTCTVWQRCGGLLSFLEKF